MTFRAVIHGMLSAAILSLLTIAVSCTAVEYTGDPVENIDGVDSQEKSSMSEIGFDISWPVGMGEEDVPQYVMVLMNRIQNTTVHYAFKMDGYGAVADSSIPSDSQESGLKIHNGQYSVAAVAAYDGDDFIVSDLEAYGESVEHLMKDVYVTIPLLSDEDITEQDYIDFNPTYPYVKSVGAFWYVRPSNATHTFISSMTGNDNIVHLNPRPLTKKIYFTINLEVEDGVAIERCVGTVSGVPQRVQLMTGAVSSRKTGKMPFEMVNTEGNAYEGHINAFGLFHSDNKELVVGPGVLAVIIHAQAEGTEGPVRRIFYANMQISDKIRKAEIMRQDEVNGYMFTSADSYRINVDKTLKVTRDMIVSGASDGYEDWVSVSTDGNPENNPGMFPEL